MLESPGEVTGFTGAMTGLMVPADLAETVSGISAGFIFDPVAGVPLVDCTAGISTDWTSGLAAGLVDDGVVRELAGELVTGKAGDCMAATDLDCAGGCKLADALACKGLVGEAATSGAMSSCVDAFRVGLPGSSLRNISSSLPTMAARIQVTQIGRAARAPDSLSPSGWLLSKPIQTPQVMEGEKPRNQASVYSLVVPVLPPSG